MFLLYYDHFGIDMTLLFYILIAKTPSNLYLYCMMNILFELHKYPNA